jgi:AcrR family transcriptional regulator
MARITRERWLEEGLKLLAGKGFKHLTLSELLARLKVTHGSFYHHFRNRRDYTEALLQAWQQQMTVDVISGTEAIGDLEQRVDQLILQSKRFPAQTALEVAMRTEAQRDPLVHRYVAAVDQIRLAHCRELAALATGDPVRAQALGNLVHAMFVGMQQVVPAFNAAQSDAIYEELKLLVLGEVRKPQPIHKKRPVGRLQEGKRG